MSHLIAIAIVLISLLCAAVAQVADDKELYAAYCIGSLTELQEQNKIDAQSPHDDPEVSTAIREGEEAVEQRLSRFRAYLAARGFFTGTRGMEAHDGIMLASRRGQSEGRKCSEAINVCIASCQRDVRSPPDCTTKCSSQNASCNAVMRCGQADDLPF
jgi:hypothetical protein